MPKVFRNLIKVGNPTLSSPNQRFNASSAYNRLTKGETLFKTKDAVSVDVKLSETSSNTVPAWRFLRDEADPGSTTPEGYWEVRKALGQEAIILTAGALPKYVCTCPDHTKRLAALPLNESNANKFSKEWTQGLLRDCKHIWAVRYLNDEVKLIELPKDIPLPIEPKAIPKSNFGINKLGNINSIQTPVKPNNWKGFS